MRKILAVAACLVMAVACSVREDGVQTVRIMVGNVRSGELGTKAVTDSEVDEALELSGPVGTPTLELRSETVSTRVFVVSAGEEVSVPTGSYRVTGVYEPTPVCRFRDNDFYAEPSYSVNATIVVREGVSEYEVEAEYTCWALVLDYGETSAAMGRGAAGEAWENVYVPTVTGDIGVLYVSTAASWEKNFPFYYRVSPVDLEGHEVTEYKLVNREAVTGFRLVSAGKWYLFGPGEIVRQSGMIGVNVGGWEKGR